MFIGKSKLFRRYCIVCAITAASIASVVLLLTSTGCTRQGANKSGTTTINFTVPTSLAQHSSPISSQTFASTASSQIFMSTLAKAFMSSAGKVLMSTSLAQSYTEQWSTLDPSVKSDVTCFFVAVSRPGSPGFCSLVDSASNPAGNIPFSVLMGWVEPGQQVALSAPSGPGQKILLFGSRKAAGVTSCPRFSMPWEAGNANSHPTYVDLTQVSKPILLGSVDVSLVPGNMTVSLVGTFDSSRPRVIHCEDSTQGGGGPGGGSMAPAYNFGNDTANVSIATADNITSSSTLSTAGRLGAYARVSNVSVSGATTTATLATGGTGTFANGDEVMFHISAADASPPNGPDSACGPNNARGRYIFFPGVTVSGSAITIPSGSWMDSLNNTNLGVSAMSSPFCYVQAVKVIHLGTLTIGGTGSLTAPIMDLSTNVGGGIIAIRVSGTLSFGTSSSWIGWNTNGGGFKGGSGGPGTTTGSQGAEGYTNASQGSVGGYSSSAGGGGGGHSAATAYGLTSGGNGGGTGSGGGGSGIGSDCGGTCPLGTLYEKFFAGGAGGGSSAYAGGNGGGIIYIQAKTIAAPGSGSASIMASGVSAGVGTGAGGGAGGSILLFTTSKSGTGDVLLQANGGNGGSGTWGGGGGAGGRVELVAPSGVVFSTSVTGGTGATGAGAGYCGTSLMDPHPYP